jgi:hypothetical protein
MLENMNGVVGYAIHDDRLALAKRNARIAHALAARKAAHANRVHPGWRLTTAKALIALATRLAPATWTPATPMNS